ncbi:MAG: carboxylesterase/lipase family protein [Candidatus Margulisiibacteriota bacterium]
MKKIAWYLVFLVLLSSIGYVLVIKAKTFGVNPLKLDSGPISGKTADGLRIYLGIPFAAPPVGELRWKAPQPVKAWQEVKPCVAFGPACPQPPVKKVGRMSEDCLYLNVWTPAKKADEKLAVMVFIYGGAFTIGAASEPYYNGAYLAKKGVVVVTFNYRVGPFGFLVHPLGLSGNYGLMDQTAALKWVKRNIAAFGGDPDKVTIFGESAGSVSVALHLIMPISQGLFRSAIAESGGPYGMRYVTPNADGSLEQALKMGEKFSQALKVTTLKEMRAKTSDEILDIFNFSPSPFSPGMAFAPVFDGRIIPANPEKLYEDGQQAKVPVIIGSNADEGNLFYEKVTVPVYKDYVKKLFGQNAAKVLAMFPATQESEVRSAFNCFLTAAMFSEPARFVARAQEQKGRKSFLYKFTRVPKTGMAEQLGAFHSLELAYVLGNMKAQGGYDKTDVKLSEQIMDYWTNFAKTGDPNGPGLPLWPAYNSKADENIEFGDSIRTNKNLLKKECDLLRPMQ